MSIDCHNPNRKFGLKHADDAEPSPIIAKLLAIRPRNFKREISCALAMQLSKSAKVPSAEVGRTLDILEFRLNLCQLGLFGHKPVSKILAPAKPNDEIAAMIRALIEPDGSLACAKIWELAKTLKVPKMTAAAYCTYLKVKIRPCQLGAF